MTPAIKKLTSWLLLFVAGLNGAIGGLGIVLCFEPDGHVSIEFAGDDCGQCCAEDSESSPDVPEQRVGACPCEDYTVSVTDLATVKTRVEAALAGWVSRPVLTVVARVSGGVHPQQRTDLPRSHSSAALPFVRSVVLRV